MDAEVQTSAVEFSTHDTSTAVIYAMMSSVDNSPTARMKEVTKMDCNEVVFTFKRDQEADKAISQMKKGDLHLNIASFMSLFRLYTRLAKDTKKSHIESFQV